MLANVLTYEERTSLTGERMQGNKEQQPSANERGKEEERRSIGRVALRSFRRGVTSDDEEVSY